MGMSGESQKKRGRIRIGKWKWLAVLLAAYDIAAICAAYYLALWLRFEGTIPGPHLWAWKGFHYYYALGCVPVFALFKMYRGMWRYSSYGELFRILLASTLTAALHAVLITLIKHTRMPLSYYFLGFVFQTGFLLLPRFAFRMIRFVNSSVLQRNDETAARVMIYGAGEAGQ